MCKVMRNMQERHVPGSQAQLWVQEYIVRKRVFGFLAAENDHVKIVNAYSRIIQTVCDAQSRFGAVNAMPLVAGKPFFLDCDYH